MLITYLQGLLAQVRREEGQTAVEYGLVIALIALVWIGLGMVVSNAYYQLMLVLVPIWAVMGLSWNLFSGYTGLVSFGLADESELTEPDAPGRINLI